MGLSLDGSKAPEPDETAPIEDDEPVRKINSLVVYAVLGFAGFAISFGALLLATVLKLF